MGSSEEIENIKILFQIQHSFVISKITFTAIELGVFDLLRESGELLSSASIAERLGTSTNGTQKLLEACVGLKLLKMEWKGNKGLYGNTELADLYLAKSSPKSQYYTMKVFSDIGYPSMQYLPDAIRKGKNQILSIYGSSSNNCYEALYRSNERLENVFYHMNETWSLHGKEVLSAFDLSGFQHIYDLGGSSGGLAKELISMSPNCMVTLFDLPDVMEKTKKHGGISESSQITFHEGDFFTDPIPEADLYILSRILWNWEDEKCLQLLNKVFKACKPGGGVLVVESMSNEDRAGPFAAHVYSILTLLHMEGTVRAPSDHHLFLSTAGFKDIQFKKGTIYDVILARKQC